jgi:hypothetical protein
VEDEKHILLQCKESEKWRGTWSKNNWWNMNEILVYKKIIACVDVNRIKSLGNYLFKVKCKWEQKVKGDASNAPHTDV